MIVYQSHNNKNGHLRTRVSTHEYLHTITLVVLINNYCYGKSQVRITRDFLFVDLRKVLNSLTSRFLRVSCGYLYTWSRIICLTKTEGLLPDSVSYEKDTRKDSEARQLIKPCPTRTILNQNEPKLLFETGQGPVSNYSFSFGFVTSCYVIMNISIAWTIDKLKIT